VDAEESTSQLNFTHSSRKSWSLIRRLDGGGAQRPAQVTRPPVSSSAVANHLGQVLKLPRTTNTT